MSMYLKCILRIRSPKEASTLVEHFNDHLLAQSTGLDTEGTIPSHPMKSIFVELVEGRKEELYWEKVPEKARRQAVHNAIRLSNDANALTESPSPPRKRRKRD